MPNQTLTLVASKQTQSGWEFKDDKGQVWWVPAADKKSGVSNEPLAAEIRDNLGKPFELSTWVKDDGSVHAIFGKARTGGGGRGGMSPEERLTERRSIEAQKAAGIAVAILGSITDLSFSATRGREWVIESIPMIAEAIRAAAEADQSSGRGAHTNTTQHRAGPPEDAGRRDATGGVQSPTSQGDSPNEAPADQQDVDSPSTSPGEEADPSPSSPPDFTFTSGKYKGHTCSTVARAAPVYLRSFLPSLDPEQRAIATYWLERNAA
jgi:hypothetical protein